jgi:ribosomal protein S18 acetylase RimI-like enzyme
VIERGRTEDADRVADLWVELAADQLAHGSHLRPAENRERIRDSVLRHAVAGTLLVAREDDVVGFATCSVETGGYDQEVRRGVVENLYVAAGHRGEGVGTALLAAAERTLVDRGCEAVGLDVMAANEDARRFYERHGYTPHRVEMERQLDGSEE